MSQLCDKRSHNISIRRLPSLRTGITLIWLEDVSSMSRERDQKFDHLCASNNCYIFRYTNVSKCLKYLKRAKTYERIMMIMTIGNCSVNSSDISRLCQYRQIQSIFIVSSIANKNNDISIDLSGNTRNEIDRIGGVFYDYELLFDKLQQLINEADEFDDDLFTIFNEQEKALRDLRSDLGPYIWSQTLKMILKAMKIDHPSEAKREILAEFRACCRNRLHEWKQIDEFERMYHSVDAILWYTKPCFLHRLINKALRTEDNLLLYKFRYFIVDLSARLEEAALSSIYYRQPFRIYRGSKLSRDEVNKLQIHSLVATNGFFSSTKDLLVAERFIGIDPNTGISPSHGLEDRLQYVLFQIDVDFTSSPEIVVTDVSGHSAIPDENEMVFNLGTTFSITDIGYDDEHRVWHINMASSSEVAKLIQEYNTHIRNRFIETKPIIMFGHVLSEFCSNYHGAITYFHRLLRSKSWNDENRPDIYHYLGRVYRALGKNQQAITYFRSALLLHRRNLPESSIAYGRALSCLGTIYSELGDLSRSIYLYEQAMSVYRRVLPKNHYEFGFHSNRLAQVNWQNGQYESARDLLTETLSFVKETMPENFPGQAQTLHYMGLVQHSLNNREQAICYFKQSLQMRETFQATDHPYAARTCYELSLLYEEQNDYPTALNYARRALCIRETKLSHNHNELKQSRELVQRLSQQNNSALLS